MILRQSSCLVEEVQDESLYQPVRHSFRRKERRKNERKRIGVEGDCNFEEPLLTALVLEPVPKLWSESVKVWRERRLVKLPDSARSSLWLVLFKC